MVNYLESFSSYEKRTSIIKICSYHNKLLQGVVQNPFFEKDVYFENLTQLLFILDTLREALHYPELTMDNRNFGSDARPPFDYAKTPAPEKTLPLATFAVKLLFCQNASWQGTIAWLDNKLETSFRSALELIILLDSVLESL